MGILYHPVLWSWGYSQGTLGLLRGCWDPNSGPHDCNVAGAEPSLQPLNRQNDFLDRLTAAASSRIGRRRLYLPLGHRLLCSCVWLSRGLVFTWDALLCSVLFTHDGGPLVLSDPSPLTRHRQVSTRHDSKSMRLRSLPLVSLLWSYPPLPPPLPSATPDCPHISPCPPGWSSEAPALKDNLNVCGLTASRQQPMGLYTLSLCTFSPLQSSATQGLCSPCCQRSLRVYSKSLP